MNYQISKQAEVDLQEIWLYTVKGWSLEQADYYFDLIMDEIGHLPLSLLTRREVINS